MKLLRSIARKFFVVAIIGLIALFGYNIILRKLHPQRYAEAVAYYSAENGLDKNLVFAVIKCESSFQKNAQSSASAKGLMQLTEETFYDVRKMLGDGEDIAYETHWNDAETNIRYGTKYLAYLKELYEGDTVAALAAYNAGMGNVNDWLGSDGKLQISEIEFPETRNYVENVLKSQKYYRKLYS